MPTYDYRCDACRHTWEEFQSMSAAPVEKCPKCGKKKARRLLSAGAGVIFKGSGFYQTDYRSESYTKAAEAESKATSEKPAESKPETKTDPTPAPASPPLPTSSKKKDG